MKLLWLTPAAGFAAVLFALWLAWDVLRRDAGTPEMQDVASMIFEGAMAFLKRQYRTIAMLALVTAVIIFLIVGGVSEGVKEIIGEKVGNKVEVTYSGAAVGGRGPAGDGPGPRARPRRQGRSGKPGGRSTQRRRCGRSRRRQRWRLRRP